MIMELDEDLKHSAKTWLRAVNSINKDGYKEGAADSQATSFQNSFDTGFEQGLKFGLNLGFNITKTSDQQSLLPEDQRKINCQICLARSSKKDNCVNLYNIQQEENDKYSLTFQNKN